MLCIVYVIYIAFIMAKDTASFKIRPELRKALKKEADKDKRTLSWYLETIVEEFAKKRKLV